MIALSPRDIGLSILFAALCWPVLNLIDRISYGMAMQ